MYDNWLPFCARLSVGMMGHMMQRRGFNVVMYLDDYLVISDNYLDCLKGLYTFITLLRLLSVGIAWEKTASPTRSLTFIPQNTD